MKVKIEWRTASFFESNFVTSDNEIIAQHFFSLDKSIFNLLEEKQAHSENILYEIQTKIIFGEESIEIDRSDILRKLKNEIGQKQVLILSGVAGVGKTAFVKKFYKDKKEHIPFYIFKANEFQLNNINDLFESFNLQDFIKAHKDEKNKIVVIDSAEKLLDLKNTDPFKEFLSILIQNNWKIIFTTRNNYLEDLNYQFIEIHNIFPLNLNIRNLSQKELVNLSLSYNFVLPDDYKLLELIKNPFYLNEYLRFYKNGENINYLNFKEKLWNKIIKKSKTNREQCFLQVAFQRANGNQFFITPVFDSQILNELVHDGILGYETAGYFITHDIYEEWALEKIIESEFIKKGDNKEFFGKIGQSLSIRRSFRNWVSEKLLLGDDSTKNFIEEIIEEEQIESFWKDEVLVSVLLSDYSEAFFDLFKEKLIENNQELLKRLTFLIRIACKEVDVEFFKQLGVKHINLFSMKYVLTKPKGEGWKSLVKFVFENLDEIDIKNIYFILPIVHDWNSKFKEGKTTKLSSLIALRYYQWIIQEGIYFSHDDSKDHLLQTILYGSSEIKNELKGIFEEILENKWKNHRDPYYNLSKVILTKFEGINVSKILPEYVLQLADLFWFYISRKDDFYHHTSMEVEQYFCMEKRYLDYFPSSAYQTPIYWLLQFSFKKTIDFILSFTNKTVECFAKSDFAKHEVDEIEIFFEKGSSTKQYISNRLWNMYRGTQNSPYVLESMHMALEKFFLERGKDIDFKTLESWLLYCLKNSKSSSISAVVTSIVLAYPEKTFNVAKILFQTKEFFLYDTNRFALDLQQKNFLLKLWNSFGSHRKNEIFEKERIKTYDDQHRKKSLEHLALNYQFFRSGEVSKEEAEKRQKIIWNIFDKYYVELPDKSRETEVDKTWRLYLARMGRRKMKPTTEEKDGQILISLNPEIDPELKKYSEKSLKKSSELMKYSSLKFWADYKMKNDKKYEQYEKYEKNFQLAIKEVKEITAKLKTIKKMKLLKIQHSEDESYYLFNHSTPANVCSVLIRDYFEKLSNEDKAFCKGIILEAAFSSFRANYQYQIFDGVESAIFVLPLLLKEFPEEKDTIKTILLITLFDPHFLGMYGPFSYYSINAILSYLWKISFNDAQAILFGYLILKPKYELLRKKLRKENYKKNVYHLNENEIIGKFLEENKIDLQKVVNNQISLDNLESIEQLDLYILKTAFQLFPLKTTSKEHKHIAKIIISTFAKELLSEERQDEIDYAVSHAFLKKLAYFILSSSKQDITNYLEPFINNFNNSEAVADLLQEFILAEDKLANYDNFWHVWNLFYEKVIELCEDGDKYGYIEEIIKSYLFAQTQREETTTNWHTLKETEKMFFKKISANIGHCPSTFFSISKLLNDIGSKYLYDGISWLSKMLDNNENLWNDKLKTNTIYYLENVVKKYIYKNLEKIKKTKKLKQEVLIILDFLIEKGSVVGYMLRENIL